MTTEPAEFDVKTALATIDRALAYTAPLQRRIEGIAWILFGLASFFLMSYIFVMQIGSDSTHLWFIPWLAGYAFLVTGPALLTWRVARIFNEGLAIASGRVAVSIAGLAVALVVVYFAIWMTLGEASDTEAVGRLILALHIVLFGSIAWATLGVAQWTRMSKLGRRDTLVLAAIMASMGVVLVYAFRVETFTLSTENPAFVTVQSLTALAFIIAFGLIPLIAGLWRLAKT